MQDEYRITVINVIQNGNEIERKNFYRSPGKNYSARSLWNVNYDGYTWVSGTSVIDLESDYTLYNYYVRTSSGGNSGSSSTGGGGSSGGSSRGGDTGGGSTLSTYTVTLNANGGAVTPTSLTVTAGGSTTLPTATKANIATRFLRR